MRRSQWGEGEDGEAEGRKWKRRREQDLEQGYISKKGEKKVRFRKTFIERNER